ncbi:putative beta-lysine N-acetyltransferase [uncultured Pseudodesulfovibrio sp.]|uniref:putative beta-lysine N-acetyltransferase n=1 Tax=uncultured Pseudodesulfovibrio sp. TaxID=2035858 RepID=UPI0029C7787D|nr:putative beta-lysine N-acetyltransferase [uncultured Pseudodesulfovibrio sp.]
MQPDEITHLGKSLVQHGPSNNRVYLMKLDQDDLPEIVHEMYELARQKGYTKLFAKVPANATSHFAALGFVDEARVPFMHKGESAGYFMSKYLDQRRAIPTNIKRMSAVLDQADQKSEITEKQTDKNEVVRLRLGNVDELAELYATVFETYPFPLHDPSFLSKSMLADTAFFGIFSDNKLVAAASMEMDMDWQCAEMTDFATLPEYRGQGAAGKLLATMDQAAEALPIDTAYTIARAESFGMNIVFSRAGYAFGGTLHNNTQIAGKLESMNIWHKHIRSKGAPV